MLYLIHLLPLLAGLAISPWAGLAFSMVLLHLYWAQKPELKEGSHQFQITLNEKKKHPLAFASKALKIPFAVMHIAGLLVMHGSIFWLMLAYMVPATTMSGVELLKNENLIALTALFSFASFCGAIDHKVEATSSMVMISGILGWWVPLTILLAVDDLSGEPTSMEEYMELVVGLSSHIGLFIGVMVFSGASFVVGTLVKRRYKASKGEVVLESIKPLEALWVSVVGLLAGVVTYSMMLSITLVFNLGGDLTKQHDFYDVNLNKASITKYDNKVTFTFDDNRDIILGIMLRGLAASDDDAGFNALEGARLTKPLAIALANEIAPTEARELVEFAKFDPIASTDSDLIKDLWSAYLKFDDSFANMVTEKRTEIKLEYSKQFSLDVVHSKGRVHLTDEQRLLEISNAKLMLIDKANTKGVKYTEKERKEVGISKLIQQIKDTQKAKTSCLIPLTAICALNW